MGKTVTTEEFIERAKNAHGNRYNYSKVNYTRFNCKIEIGCLTHGLFIQRADHHLNGSGCKKCARNVLSLNVRIARSSEFVSRAKKVHGDKFDYTLVGYVKANSKVWIICKEHGKFLQCPDKHLHGRGCPKCKFSHAGETQRYTTEHFVELSKIKHKDRYDYSLVNYKNRGTPVVIICKKHGEFSQVPDYHLSGNGCRKCFFSKGEEKIEKFLKTNLIDYESEKSFPTCKSYRTLRFDFFLPKINVLIEYDGLQHFKCATGIWNDTEEKLQERIKRDKIKTDWAKDNEIKLIRINYKQFDLIENILKTELIGN